MSSQFEDYRAEDLASIATKVKVPAIMLIVIGVLNGLVGGWGAFSYYQYLNLPPVQKRAVNEEIWEKQFDTQEQRDQLKGIGIQDKEDFFQFMDDVANVLVYVGIAWVVIGILTVVGGVRMSRFQGYRLAMLVSILNVIPAMALLSCCGIGQIVGIWSIVVLCNQDVRAVFANPYLLYGEEPYPPEEENPYAE